MYAVANITHICTRLENFCSMWITVSPLMQTPWLIMIAHWDIISIHNLYWVIKSYWCRHYDSLIFSWDFELQNGAFYNLCAVHRQGFPTDSSTFNCCVSGVQNWSARLCHQQVINLSGRAKGDGIHWPLKDRCSEYDLTVRLTTL